jgi:hypothetical protein
MLGSNSLRINRRQQRGIFARHTANVVNEGNEHGASSRH